MPNLLNDEQSGHDAQIERVVIDPVGQTVTVSFLAYEERDARERIAIEVHFTSVSSASTVMGFENLAINHGAGNVAYWEMAEREGTSFIHLTGGTIAITARAAPTLVKLPR